MGFAHIAAMRLGQRIAIAPIKTIFDDMTQRIDYVVAEGVGGWRGSDFLLARRIYMWKISSLTKA